MNYSERLPEPESSDTEGLELKRKPHLWRLRACLPIPKAQVEVGAGLPQARCNRLGPESGKSGLTAARPKEPQEGVLCTDSTFFSPLVLQCAGLSSGTVGMS